MLALAAFDVVPGEPVAPAMARRRLDRVLDVAECRIMSMTSFLNGVFVNGRLEGASGHVVRLHWDDGVERETVLFELPELDRLVEKYQRYEAVLLAARMTRHPLEELLWQFLRACHAERLVVLSCSTLVLQEYE